MSFYHKGAEKMSRSQYHRKGFWLSMTIIGIGSLLGTSYAFWTKNTIVETKMTTTFIDATGQMLQDFDIRKRVDPIFKINVTKGSLPIQIRKIEILNYRLEITRPNGYHKISGNKLGQCSYTFTGTSLEIMPHIIELLKKTHKITISEEDQCQGEMLVRITYTQFNTKEYGGWEKILDFNMDITT